ncbi:MAG: ABC transporter substrate-binding protein [Actinomycetota bacterium]
MRRGGVRVLASVATAVVLVAGAAPGALGQQRSLVRISFPRAESLTPYTFVLGYPLMTLVYDTLMWRDTQGRPRPWLARSVTTSPDGTEVTVRLRDGIRFHDGEPLTSADVVFTFELVQSRYHPRFTPQVQEVADVSAPDASTVVFTLRRRAAGFADQPLSDVPIVPRHLWAGLSPERPAPRGLAIGSGPYRLTRRAAGGSYRFEANDDYFLGAPQPDILQVDIEDDLDATLEAFEGGDLDALAVPVSPGTATRLERVSTRLERGPLYAGTVLMLNAREPPFDDARARRAVATALDLDRISAASGDAIPGERGYLHPTSRWAPDADLHDFDEAGARAAARRLDLPAFEVLAPENDPLRLEAGRQVVLALGRAGFEAALRPLPRDALGQAVGEDRARPRFTAAIWTSPPLASYDPGFLGAIFGSDPRAAPINYTGYRSPAFDARMDPVVTTGGVAARRGAVEAALRLLARDVPAVPLFFVEGAFPYRSAAHDGWVFVAGSGILDKLSFLPQVVAGDTGGPERRDPNAGTSAPSDRRGDTASTGLGPFGYVTLALLGVALALVAAEVRRRVRP